MQLITQQDCAHVSGGATDWSQAAVGLGAVFGPIAIAGGPAVVGGHVTGVVAAGGVTSTIALANGGGVMVTGTAAVGGTVVGIGVVPVAAVAAVATGG
ncbi:MAG: hypothetical protein ACOYLV_16740, partial [Rubrivivax sp.]